MGNPRVLQSHFDAVSSQLEESLESPFLVVLALSLLRHDSNKIEMCLMPNSYRPKTSGNVENVNQVSLLKHTEKI